MTRKRESLLSGAARHFACLEAPLVPLLLSLGICTLSRVLLLWWLQDRVSATGGTATVLLEGVRFDLVVLAFLFGIPLALTPVFSLSSRVQAVWLRALYAYSLFVIGLFAFMEVATPPFILEYDVRPNFLFVEYLIYPREVGSMLWTGYKLELLVAALAVPSIVFLCHRILRARTRGVPGSQPLSVLPLTLVLALACVAAGRSTLDHRPVNPSTAAFSADTLVNSLPLSSLYSVLYAIYATGYEDSGFAYGDVEAAASVEAVHRMMQLPDSAFPDREIPTLRRAHSTTKAARARNLIIVVEESLGAELVGKLGGLPLTPELDRFADQGIWFEQLYATGTRSARGLEAIVAGYPPTTSQSVLKLNRAQQDFFTLGQLLSSHGFDTSFIYGGETHFDNMQRFFANNGFRHVVGQNDFESPVFRGSWGVSDEDTFDYAHRLFSSYSPDEPFFSVVFTTSNHSPWEFPEGRIELYEHPRATQNNAVRYADHALGKFLERAQKSNYWHDTVIAVVADHNSRVYGSQVVPIERFRIPGLILGADIEPQRWSTVASQIDLLPTLLSLIGVGGLHPAPGIDLTRRDLAGWPGRAIMQYGDTLAYREGDDVAVLRKHKPPACFRYERGELVTEPDRPEVVGRARALSAWATRTYRERRYRLPGPVQLGSATLRSSSVH